jgi:hypothetical protein
VTHASERKSAKSGNYYRTVQLSDMHIGAGKGSSVCVILTGAACNGGTAARVSEGCVYGECSDRVCRTAEAVDGAVLTVGRCVGLGSAGLTPAVRGGLCTALVEPEVQREKRENGTGAQAVAPQQIVVHAADLTGICLCDVHSRHELEMQRPGPGFILVVSKAERLLLVGRSKDFVQCRATNKGNGERCRNYVRQLPAALLPPRLALSE